MKRLCCLLVLLASGVAHAQPAPPRASDGVVLPSQGLAATDDTSAIAVNPANLAFLPGPEVRLSWIHSAEAAPLVNRGYAVDLGVPFWILATGIRVDWLLPTASTPAPYADNGDGHRFNWTRWGTAVRLGDLAAVGTTLAWSTGTTADLDGWFSATSGLTVRPARYLSAAVVVRDWNTPESNGGLGIDPSIDGGVAVRPIGGRRLLELGLDGSYRTGIDRWLMGANAGVDIPYVGRMRAGAQLLEFEQPKVIISTGLEVNLDQLQVSGGALFGNHLTAEGTGFYAGAAYRSFRTRPGVPSVSRVVRIRIESTPTVRGHVAVLQALWRLSHDDEVEGVLLELRASPVPSMAHAEELADAIELLRSQGKKVLCHLEDAGGRELYACSAADRIAMNPAGGLRFAGLAQRYLYFGGALDKLGVRADFVRIGEHKLAPEQFVEGSSEVGRRDHVELLGELERIYLDQIAAGRGIARGQVGATLAKGPFIAPEARDARLLDALVYDDEIERWAEEVLGGKVKLRDWERPDEAPEYWRDPPKVAIVYLSGNMIDGRSRNIPIVDVQLAGSYTIAAALKQAREDKSVRAVVLRIESGGGSSLCADLILREAALTAKAKPLIVSMGGAAASGGYYAAVAAREILANRATLTGSIGIFYGKVDVSGLLDKLGVRVEGYRTAPRADAESFFRPFSDDERRELGVKVKQFYDLFIGRVAEGRKMTPAEVDALARGKVWTGEQAKARGLVDRVGGLRQALARARELGDLSAEAPVLELPAHEATLLERALELVGVPKLDEPAALGVPWLPGQLLEVMRAFAPFLIYEDQKPLALMELVVAEP